MNLRPLVIGLALYAGLCGCSGSSEEDATGFAVHEIYIIDSDGHRLEPDGGQAADIRASASATSSDLHLFWDAVGEPPSGGYTVEWFVSQDRSVDRDNAGTNGRLDVKFLQTACHLGSTANCPDRIGSIDCDYDGQGLRCDGGLYTDLSRYLAASSDGSTPYYLLAKIEDGLSRQRHIFAFLVSFH